MRYKLQVPGGGGWADLKVSEDGGGYEPDLYETRKEAMAHGTEMKQDIPDFEFRVVPEDEEQDFDLYD